jgi:hypothetical protein
MSSDIKDSRIMANNWTQTIGHVDNEGFPADTMMCFSHNGKRALAFHTGNGDHVGIVCSEFFKCFGQVCLAGILRIAKTLFLPARV